MSTSVSRSRSTGKLWPWLALCLLLSTRWMLADAFPASVSTLSSESLASLLAAIVWLFLAARQRRAESGRRGSFLVGFIAGALLFAGLHSGLLFPGVPLKSSDLMISSALTPIVIAVGLLASGEASGSLGGRDLAPGLAAGTGLLLILPQPAFHSFSETAVLLLTPLAVGVSTVWLPARLAGVSGRLYFGLASAGAAIVFGLPALRSPRSLPALAGTALDLLTVVLTLLALQRAGARRFGALFAAVPLILLLEGLLFSHVVPDWRQTGGLLLLGCAAILLLRRHAAGADEATLHLLT